MTKRSGKVRRTESYRYLVADPTSARQAFAQARLDEMRTRGQDGHEAAGARLQEAEAGVAACFATLILGALPPDEHEDFVQELAEAAPSPDVDTEPQPPVRKTWREDSFEVRFLAACDLDPEHTPAWWASEFNGPEWSLKERDELLDVCYRVNSGGASVNLDVLGKG